MDDQPTCGQGLAEHSQLPAILARLMAATANVLERHQAALVLDDEHARREHEAYGSLAKAHRTLAEGLQSTAREMAGYRDLPMGRHDEQVMMSTGALDAFEGFVKAERELLALVEAAVERDGRMLDGIRGLRFRP
jgi:hypothetical protein